ncbi:MAG: HD domain-containing protein [Treponema sp.]|nr:HD domain-containing protein [Treponema sp.]
MKLINITLDAYNILLGIILFVAINMRHIVNAKVKNGFKAMVLVNCCMAAMNALTLIVEGSLNPVCVKILPVSLFLFYIFSFSVLVIAGIEMMFYLNLAKYRKPFLVIVLLVILVYVGLIIANTQLGFLYYIDENNFYFRGERFYSAQIVRLFLFINFFIYLIINAKSVNKEHILFITAFILFPQTMQLLQIAFSGVLLLNTGYTISFLIMFIHSNRHLEENLDSIEYELDAKETELNNKITEIEQSKLEFIKMQNHTIESLSNLVENRDEDTGEHVRRTREYVELLAVQLMKNNHYPDILTPRYVRFLKRAAPMHDIGKIIVPDAILKKPGRLTPEEFALMKCHASEGGRIVHEIFDGYEDPEYIKITADIAMYHHEKWDGSGYPSKLKGNAIPLSARIMALADVFDALVSPRVYKSPMSYEEAFTLIEENSGIHFDPVIAQEFLNIKEKAAAINESYRRVD